MNGPIDNIVSNLSTYNREEPSKHHRYINRNGKRIHQVMWYIHVFEHHYQIRTDEQWRDVPYIPGAEQGDMTVHP